MGWFTQTCFFCRECVWLSLNPRVEVFRGKRIEVFRNSFNYLCYDLRNYFLRDALLQQPVYTRYDLATRKTQHGAMLLQCSLDVLRQIFWRWSVSFHPLKLWRCACDVTGTPFLELLAFLVLRAPFYNALIRWDEKAGLRGMRYAPKVR